MASQISHKVQTTESRIRARANTGPTSPETVSLGELGTFLKEGDQVVEGFISTFIDASCGQLKVTRENVPAQHS